MRTICALTSRSIVPMVVGIALLASCGGETEETAALQAPPPVIDMKDFFKNPEKSGYRISPDGQYFSFRAPWKNRMNIFVQKVGDSTAMQVTADTIRDVSGYFWKGDRIVYSRDINGDENFIVFSASLDGKDVKALTPEKGVRAGTMDDLLLSGIFVNEPGSVETASPTIVVDASGDPTRTGRSWFSSYSAVYPEVDSVEADHRVWVYRFHR